MRKITLLTLLMAVSLCIFSQTNVPYYKWSDPMTFQLSPRPRITGYGYYSDSLSKMFDGKTFYVHNDVYYPIESWADYYLWFTKVYYFKFEDPQLYEFYYWGGDDHGMASYIASNKYKDKYYPSSIFVDFRERPIKNNRLATDENFLNKEDEIDAFIKKLKYEKENDIKEDDSDKKEGPEIFIKEDFRKKEFKKEPTNTKMELKDESTPKRKVDQSSPKSQEDKFTPKSKEDESSPKRKIDQSSPKSNEDQISPIRKEDESSPKRKVDQSSPKEKNEMK
ncbi:MAG: hypothetical protein RBT49_07360 [Bacteroidales bacterium]|jgi:hypothetical protein|nr:hypothetical protein [Bacteroidales bacterium]